MQIVPVGAQHVDDLLAIYLSQVANSPHSCFVPDRALFSDELFGRSSLPASLFDPPLQSQVFVAEEAGVVQGFARLVRYVDWDKSEKQAITGLFFTEEAAGDALVRACEAQAPAGEVRAFPAAHGNTFIHGYNGCWDGLSDHVPNVAQVLSRHGYRPYFRELQLRAPLQQPYNKMESPPPGIKFRLAETPTPAYERQALQAMDGDGDEEIGICAFSTLGFLKDRPAASQIGYVWWLHVSEAYRQRGLARALITTAMARMVEQGCTTCWLTTTADNWRAQPLYYSLGFEVLDCSVSFRKQLKEGTPS